MEPKDVKNLNQMFSFVEELHNRVCALEKVNEWNHPQESKSLIHRVSAKVKSKKKKVK